MSNSVDDKVDILTKVNRFAYIPQKIDRVISKQPIPGNQRIVDENNQVIFNTSNGQIDFRSIIPMLAIGGIIVYLIYNNR